MAPAPPAIATPPSERAICLSVVSHGQGEMVDRLLADLAGLSPGTVARIVVTVNLPADRWQPQRGPGSADNVTVIRNPLPLGFGANHNQAFGVCAEPVFAVVNPDIRLPADPFAALLQRLDGGADCALVAPVQVDAAGRRETFARPVPTPWNVALRRLLPAAARRAGTAADAPRAAWVAGAFMVWRATAFRELGGFDDRYRLYCEDVDICLRLQLLGKRFAIVESACVVHDAQRASRRSLRLGLVHVQSLLRLWLSPVYWRFVMSPRLPAQASPT